MAFKFSKSMSGMFIYQSLVKTLNTTAYASFAIYKGVRPTPAEIAANWSSYNRPGANTNLLWNGNLVTKFDHENNELYSESIALTAPPMQAGTATWALMLTTGASAVNSSPFSTASLPPSYTRFVTFDVSDLSGDAPLRLGTLDLDPANGDLTLIDFTLKALT